jgi:MarR family transcriptional regulator, transcriptional regulator for hemolysin
MQTPNAPKRISKIISKLIVSSLDHQDSSMPLSFPEHNFIFALAELQRMVRSYAEQKVSRFGITRAQWAVLAKLEKTEGQQQATLAKAMEMQPITLKRLIDPLCAKDLIERRSDESDGRAYRLYLKPAGRALVARLKSVRNELNQQALIHLKPVDAARLVEQLSAIKENVRSAQQADSLDKNEKKKERRYG